MSTLRALRSPQDVDGRLARGGAAAAPMLFGVLHAWTQALWSSKKGNTVNSPDVFIVPAHRLGLGGNMQDTRIVYLRPP